MGQKLVQKFVEPWNSACKSGISTATLGSASRCFGKRAHGPERAAEIEPMTTLEEKKKQTFPNFFLYLSTILGKLLVCPLVKGTPCIQVNLEIFQKLSHHGKSHHPLFRFHPVKIAISELRNASYLTIWSKNSRFLSHDNWWGHRTGQLSRIIEIERSSASPTPRKSKPKRPSEFC